MAKKEEPETAGFPITLGEFLNGIKQPEMKRAFQSCMKKTETTGHKTSAEWQALFELFQNKPVTVPWKTWLESQIKGEEPTHG